MRYSDGIEPSLSQRRSRPRWQRLLPLLIPFAAVWVLVVLASANLYFHAGAFWRDELSSIILARLPTLSDMFANLERDSAPLLFAYLIKFWIALGLGTSYSGLVLLGFVVYGGIGWAIYWANRSLGVRLPLLGPVLLLVNGVVFYWGTSIRSYGLAALLAAILVGSVWRFISRGFLKWWALSALTATLCAQANYQNTCVIFSVCMAGMVVCLVRRQWWRSAATLFAGVCAAVSLIPYYPVIVKVSVWKILLPSPSRPLGRTIDSFFIDLGCGRKWLGVLWTVIPIYLVTVACKRCWNARRPVPLGTRNGRILFAGMSVLLLALTVPLFAWEVGRPMMPWYYLPSFTVLACFLDLPLERFRRRRHGIWLISVAATILLLLQIPALLSLSVVRRTNLDILAAHVGELSSSGDFIIVSPIWVGQAFKYYYHGTATWKLAPGLTSQDVDRMDGDSILELARHPQFVIAPLNQEIERTLRSGHTVWIVGNVLVPPEGKLPPPPKSLKIMDCLDYWYSVVGLYLHQHAVTGGAALQVATTGEVMYLENLKVRKFSGWKE